MAPDLCSLTADLDPEPSCRNSIKSCTKYNRQCKNLLVVYLFHLYTCVQVIFVDKWAQKHLEKLDEESLMVPEGKNHLQPS
jgi:hypothetical protein